MQKVLTILSTAFSVGCTALDTNSNFDDAIAAINTKHKYKQIIAKPLAPQITTLQGANLVDAKLTLVGNFSDTDSNIPSSFFKLSVTTFKSYMDYSTVKYKGNLVSVSKYAPTSEMCSDNCTTTQYLKIPVDNTVLEEVSDDGLIFELENANKTSRYSFAIPKGYVDAVTSLDDTNEPSSLVAGNVENTKTKPVEMFEYWYLEASVESQSRFANWAIENRKTVSQPFNASNKPEEMMGYWFNKATNDERKQVLTWLVVQ